MAVGFTEKEYRKLGTYPFLRNKRDRRGVFAFFEEELDRALRDLYHEFAFGARVAHYARGQFLEDLSPQEREAAGAEARDFFARICPKLKRLLYTTKSPYTRLHTLRSLIVGIPVASPEPENLLEVWLYMFHLLYRQEEQEDQFVKLAIKGCYRWATSYIPQKLLEGSKWMDFIKALPLGEKKPYPEIKELKKKIYRRAFENREIPSLLAAATFTVIQEGLSLPEPEKKVKRLRRIFAEETEKCRDLLLGLEIPLDLVDSMEREAFLSLVRENLSL